MTKTENLDDNRLAQIASIASSEPLWSPLYFAHIGLLLFASGSVLFLFGVWWLPVIVAVYSVLFTLEKFYAARALNRADASGYVRVLGLLLVRAFAYNALVLSVWLIDEDIFKMAAVALLVAATINIMVFHATYLAIIACVVGPIWTGFVAMAVLFFIEYGRSPEAFGAILIVCCISPYFYLALLSAQDRYEELERARAALSRTQRQEVLGGLVAGVAHDFNNILAVTLGYAELLKDGALQERDNGYVDEIARAAERGASLVRHLLAFARRAELEPGRHDVEEILQDFEAMISRIFPSNISVSTIAPASLPPVFVDRHQLDIALLNLAINARDAMKSGGNLTIEAASKQVTPANRNEFPDPLALGTYISFKVSDTGTGIAPEMQEKIFDPFFTTKSGGEGSGLGLSMVLGHAQQSGGTVTVQSQVGAGTEMTLIIPAASEDASLSERTAHRVPSNANATILLVEVETSVRQLFENQLSTNGHQVSVATNGQEAAAILRDGLRPDILISDNVMPGQIQGVDLVQIAETLYPGIATIILSGHPQEAQDGLKGAGSNARVLSKPIKREDLLEAIRIATKTPAS
ncbi:MAG: ATP-binding protein [Pseudomonadota bacterium]